ncbi:twin-arginine translocase TatA/TatE family subunit [Agrococcus sp. Ld7]|uniref:twin-arginine translocase TatA/TatE family subunit n=1 Tax=Agrococcus sp. Ld7 TaxID=649148 RepID=UPI0038654F03
MPFGNLTGWHFLILLVVVLLVWGSTKLPALAESIGKSAKILKKELRSDDEPAAGPDRSATGTDRTGTGDTPRDPR